MKNLGGGVKKRAAKESDSLSDNDSDSDSSVKPRKKLRGATGGRNSGGTKSIGVSRGSKSGKSDEGDEARNWIMVVTTSPQQVMFQHQNPQ